MASLRQVAQAVAKLAADACYPNGIAAPSVTGGVVRCAADDPRSAQLEADLRAGGAFLRVLPRPGVARSQPVSLIGEQELDAPPPTMSASFDGAAVSFSGTVTPGSPVLVVVDGRGYGVAPGAGDTLDSVAAALAAVIPGAQAQGAVLAIPGALNVLVLFPALSATVLPLLRQVQGFVATIFAPGPDAREAIGTAVKLAMLQTPRLALPDGTIGTLTFTAELDDNRPSKELAFERALLCQVEYDTVLRVPAFAIGAVGGVLGTPGTAVMWGTTGAPVSVLTDGAGDVLLDSGGDLVGVA